MTAHSATARPAKVQPASSDEATETLSRVSDSLMQVSSEYMSWYTEGLTTAMAASGDTSRLLNETCHSYTQLYNASVQRFAGIARDCLACRTLTDTLDLQQRVITGVNTDIAEAGKLLGAWFEAWSRALDPLVARAADEPQRLFRAIAD